VTKDGYELCPEMSNHYLAGLRSDANLWWGGLWGTSERLRGLSQERSAAQRTKGYSEELAIAPPLDRYGIGRGRSRNHDIEGVGLLRVLDRAFESGREDSSCCRGRSRDHGGRRCRCQYRKRSHGRRGGLGVDRALGEDVGRIIGGRLHPKSNGRIRRRLGVRELTVEAKAGRDAIRQRE
jgi:hypothetical protein